MKKLYSPPALDIVFLVSTEIVTESPLGLSSKSADGGLMYGKQRNPIWEEDE